MVAKRTSISSVGRPAKAAKAAPSPESDKLAPVTDLMTEYCTLDDSCNNMLAAALPLALKTKKEERHAFEASVIKAFEDACGDAEAACKAAVEAAKAALIKHEEEKANSAASLEAAEKNAGKAVEQKTAAQGYHDEKEKARDEAEAALKGAEKDLEASQKEVEHKNAKKEEFDKESEAVLPALKEGTFAPKDWRLRQKTIARLSQLLKQSDAPESMIAASQLAFKDKPESRGQFAVKTVEATEACLKAYSETLMQAINDASSKAEELRGVATAKEEAAKAAQAEHDAAQDALITASNEWVDADTEVVNLKTAIRDFGRTEESLKAELADGQASFERFQDLMRKFESLRDQVPPPAAEVAGEGADAVPSAPMAEGGEAAPSAPVAEGEQA